jgi:kumamolisin
MCAWRVASGFPLSERRASGRPTPPSALRPASVSDDGLTAPPFPDPDELSCGLPSERRHVSREEFAARWGAAQEDLDAVAAFGKENGLAVAEASVARRTVVLSGTVEQLSRAFGVELARYQSPRGSYRGREGHVHVPERLEGIVVGVFGLDDRRMARRASNGGTGPLGYAMTPPQVASFYNFPAQVPAAGQTIGLIEFSGGLENPTVGYFRRDVDDFFASLGRPTPTIVDVSVDGAANHPFPLFGGDAEVVLDIDVAGSVAEGAALAVYFAPWTEQGWVDVITAAIHDTTNHPRCFQSAGAG